ncbi:MAG: hypothetical protein QXS37_06725, partial [Candidatus Aenigmatarchaeota archaeon]
MQDSQVYNELNKAWKSTCKIIFGEEIGELKEYEEWLKEYMPTIGKRKSVISGKDVFLAYDKYCKNSNYISLDERKEVSIEPLTINEIKDIDSIVEAISNKWYYVGNKTLGRSTLVEGCDVIFDSQVVADSFYIVNSSFVFASSAIRDSKYVFGTTGIERNSEFIVRCTGADNAKRCFEVRYGNTYSSDCYFGNNLENCSDLMFCFGQRNKRYMIGNLQLTKDKYFQIKSKLIEEIREELKKEKKFPSLYELIGNDQ